MVIVQVVEMAFALVLGGLIVHWAVERQRLRRFVQSFGVLPADPRRLALEVAGRLFTRPHGGSDPPYLLKALGPPGATPSALIDRGGWFSRTAPPLHFFFSPPRKPGPPINPIQLPGPPPPPLLP